MSGVALGSPRTTARGTHSHVMPQLDPRRLTAAQPSILETEHNNAMADNEIATRAPESDAQEKPTEQTSGQTEGAEQSVFPDDTPAQSGPTMGVGWAWLLTGSIG